MLSCSDLCKRSALLQAVRSPHLPLPDEITGSFIILLATGAYLLSLGFQRP
jgi:hypothetical protein